MTDYKKKKDKEYSCKLNSFNGTNNRNSYFKFHKPRDLFQNLDSNKERNFYKSFDTLFSKYSLPKERILIEKQVLKNVIKDIKERYSGRFTIKSLGSFLGVNLSNPLYKGSSISVSSFKKLIDLVDYEVPHKIVVGSRQTLRLSVQKCSKLAEFIGFFLVRGRMSIYSSHNSSSKSYEIYISLRKYVRIPKFINYMKTLISELFDLEDSDINYIYDENEKICAFQIYSLGIFYELCELGVHVDDWYIPKWILNNEKYIIYCLKGMFNGHGIFSLGIQNYKDSVYEDFFITFEKGSLFSRDIANGFKSLCSKLNIETSKIYKRNYSDGENRERIVVNINKKGSYSKFLTIVNPIIWEIKKKEIYTFYRENGIDPNTILNYNYDYLLQHEYSYTKELGEVLLHLFEKEGNYDSVVEVFSGSIDYNEKRPLGKDRVIEYIKSLFEEPDYVKSYGKNGYDKWYKNNARIIFGDSLESITFPYYLNIKIFRRIYYILIKHFFHIDNNEVIHQVSDYFINKKMTKLDDSIGMPLILEYGRFSYILKDFSSKVLFHNYFNLIIDFIREIKDLTEDRHRISYISLAKKYKILFYHHQYVKTILKDLESEFSKSFKVGYDQEYRWNALKFKWHEENFKTISDKMLYNRLVNFFHVISKQEYDQDIFRISNPRCSDFLISGSRSFPISSKILIPYIERLINSGLIETKENSELGFRLIQYVNLAEDFYKSKYPTDLYDSFLSDEDNIYHTELQNYIFSRDPYILGTEILVWLEINFPNLDIDYLSGHVDFMFYFNNSLYICDYKPEFRDRIFLKSLPQVASYGLILLKILNIQNLKIKCITFSKEKSWEYDPLILCSQVSEVVNDLKNTYPINNSWELYLGQFYQFQH